MILNFTEGGICTVITGISTEDYDYNLDYHPTSLSLIFMYLMII